MNRSLLGLAFFSPFFTTNQAARNEIPSWLSKSVKYFFLESLNIPHAEICSPLHQHFLSFFFLSKYGNSSFDLESTNKSSQICKQRPTSQNKITEYTSLNFQHALTGTDWLTGLKSSCRRHDFLLLLVPLLYQLIARPASCLILPKKAA